MLMSSVKLLPRDTLLESGSTLRMLPANAEAENTTPNRSKHTADFIPCRTITILLGKSRHLVVFDAALLAKRYGHLVPAGSCRETAARSSTLTTPSPLTSARESNPLCPATLPNEALTIEMSIQSICPSPFTSALRRLKP